MVMNSIGSMLLATVIRPSLFALSVHISTHFIAHKQVLRLSFPAAKA